MLNITDVYIHSQHDGKGFWTPHAFVMYCTVLRISLKPANGVHLLTCSECTVPFSSEQQVSTQPWCKNKNVVFLLTKCPFACVNKYCQYEILYI